VRDWITTGTPGGAVRVDDGDTSVLQQEPSDVVDGLFSAGSVVAFRLTRDGRYAGGLDGVDPALVGARSTLHMAGIVHVADGRVAGGQIIRDRLGMARSLTSVRV
jgi:hypothetical protein